MKTSLMLGMALFASVSALGGTFENDGPGASVVAGKENGQSIRLRASSGSAFTPPQASDVQFVITSGGDLGKTAGSGYPSHTIRIPLTIDRVFGDKNLLLSNGGLPDHVTLRMIVWDVDSESSYYPPEKDEVFVNGEKVGTLSGSNQIWTDNTFQVPTRLLNLKSRPEDNVSNTIQVNVDVDNGGWITKVDWVSIYIPAPPPIVISHGIRSNAEGLAYMQACLENIGLPVHNFSYDNNGNNGIKQDAVRLKEEVKNAMNKFKVKSVNIVCHSMGGLKARQYAENCRNDEVLKIVQIATPNAGSPLADVMLGIQTVIPTYIEEHLVNDWLLGDVLNGSAKAKLGDGMIEDLAETTLREYNKEHPFNKKVWYGIVAGNITDITFSDNPGYWIAHKWLKIFKKYPQNDAIVPLDSAFTWPINSSFSYMKMMEGNSTLVNHSALVLDGVDNWLVYIKPFLLERKETTKESKVNRTGAKNQLRSKLSASARLFSSSPTLETKDSHLMKTGELASETVQTISFAILKGGDSVVMMSLSNCAQLEAKLISPSNVEYPVSNGDVVIYATTNAFNCVMEKPEVGEWRIQLKPTLLGGASTATYLLVQAEENDGVSIAAGFDESSVKMGESLILRATASLDGDMVGGSCNAFVKNPDGSKSAVSMRDDGVSPDAYANDGVYTTSIETTSIGRYWATIVVDAESPSAFSRMCVVSGVAFTDNAELLTASSSVTDKDGNGFYDELVVGFKINVAKTAKYRILTEISDMDGSLVSQSWSDNIDCAVGENTINVVFDGESIYQHGDCEGYVISSVKLIEVSDSYEAVVDTKTDMLTVTNWKYDQFEHSALWIGPGCSETPNDNNGDGIYDILNVTIPLVSEGSLSGAYQWSAALVDSDGLVMGFTSGSVLFPNGGGTTDISLTFNGPDIAISGSDGPYYVRNFIFWGNNETFSLPGQFATRAYRIQEWGGTPKATTTPIIKADVKWAYNVSSDSFFAQLKMSCTNGTPAQIGGIRYLFEKRTSPLAYLCDKAGREWTQTITEVSENSSFNGRTFYYVDIDLADIRTSDVGTAFTYGVQSEIPEDGIVDRVPADERKIGLWIAGRDTLINKATTEIANDYLGWLSWESGGKTNYIAVGNSALQVQKVVKAGMLSSSKALPPTVSEVNRALALGASVLMEGSDPSCEIAKFTVSADSINGTIELVSENGVRSVPGKNIKATLYGSSSPNGFFQPLSELTLDGSGYFSTSKPEDVTFFKVLIEVIDIVE